MTNQPIVISKEEHAAAIATPEGMSSMLSRLFALMITAFWGGAYAPLEKMVENMVPASMVLSQFLMENPDLTNSDIFAKKLEEVKSETPNMNLRQLLETAKTKMGGIADEVG